MPQGVEEQLPGGAVEGAAVLGGDEGSPAVPLEAAGEPVTLLRRGAELVEGRLEAELAEGLGADLPGERAGEGDGPGTPIAVRKRKPGER